MRELACTVALRPTQALKRGRARGDGFADAVARAVAKLRPLARRWSSDSDSAEDLLQQTVERALCRSDHFRPGSNLAAWMRTILYRLAVDETRRQQRERIGRAGYALACAGADLDIADKTSDLLPKSGLTRRDLRRAMCLLDEPFRTTFFLWSEARLPYKEISLRSGVPIGTVATRLLRARRMLKHMLAQHGVGRGTPTVPSRSGGNDRRCVVEAPGTAPGSASAR